MLGERSASNVSAQLKLVKASGQEPGLGDDPHRWGRLLINLSGAPYVGCTICLCLVRGIAQPSQQDSCWPSPEARPAHWRRRGGAHWLGSRGPQSSVDASLKVVCCAACRPAHRRSRGGAHWVGQPRGAGRRADGRSPQGANCVCSWACLLVYDSNNLHLLARGGNSDASVDFIVIPATNGPIIAAYGCTQSLRAAHPLTRCSWPPRLPSFPPQLLKRPRSVCLWRRCGLAVPLLLCRRFGQQDDACRGAIRGSAAHVAQQLLMVHLPGLLSSHPWAACRSSRWGRGCASRSASFGERRAPTCIASS